MKIKTAITLSALMTIGLSSMTTVTTAEAGGFGPMNMMNPSRWFGGNRNRRYNDDYYDDGPGYGGYPPPGYGYGAPGAYPGGYGAPGYGAPPQPGYAAPVAPATPSATPTPDTGSADRIRELEDRIRQLESNQRQPPMPPQGYRGGQSGAGGGYPPPQQSGGYQGSGGSFSGPQSPAFRPVN